MSNDNSSEWQDAFDNLVKAIEAIPGTLGIQRVMEEYEFGQWPESSGTIDVYGTALSVRCLLSAFAEVDKRQREERAILPPKPLIPPGKRP